MIYIQDNNKGFTLFEIIIAVAILAVISMVALRAFSDQTTKARDAKRKAEIEQVHKFAEQFFTETGTYPSGTITSALATLSTAYLGRINEIKDPKNTGEFVYVYETPFPSETRGYCLCAKMEKVTNGNSGEACNFSAGTTHFCKRNIQ